jgi:hypothetical protein
MDGGKVGGGEGRGIRGGLLHGAVLRLRPAAMKFFKRTVPRDPELAGFLCLPCGLLGPRGMEMHGVRKTKNGGVAAFVYHMYALRHIRILDDLQNA